ncbi:TonB-dependent receptor [Paucibacter sp. APW11]|uniref:TonB-dependent receptor n=1 Tax=Roseateles aquae TaxID=3077235 RepID=A0ABU3P6N5_9BURK|nr:TonB-dependent receptor [Paucibacter sp. APW11]MDT8998230.1 TonB-dependent receptor [Paucibacter sp. APW11]
MNSKFLRRKPARGLRETPLHATLRLALLGGLSLSSGLANAQGDTAAVQMDRVTVTGSNIRRISAESPNPVQVISADELKKSGYTDVSSVLRNITANGQGTLSQGFSGAFAAGASGVSLRGLMVGATLVLIDGRRMAPYPIGDDGQRQFVDVSNIPFEAIERIEVLKDGASAVYGSDAIAGVVNVILKRSFSGAQLSADYGQSSRGDGRTKHATAIIGSGDLASDGYNAYLSAEVRQQDQIRVIDRPGVLTERDFRKTGGYDLRYGAPNAANGGLPRSASGYLTDESGAIVGFFPGCDAAKLAAGQCIYEDNWSQLQPATRNVNLLARYTRNLDRDWQFSLQASQFQSKAEQISGPSNSSPDGYQGVAFGPTSPLSVLSLPPSTIGRGNPSFPAGTAVDRAVLRKTFLDVGPNRTLLESKASRLVADLHGRLGEWDLSAAAGLTQVTLDIVARGAVDAGRLQTALDRSNNPYLVGGKNSAEVLDFIAPDSTARDSSKLRFLNVSAQRELMELGGGALAVSLGADLVHRSTHAEAPEAIAAGRIAGINTFAIGEQDVKSVYAELSAPLSKALELDAAVRYDHYNLSGGRASPKLGFKFQPNASWGLRGTVSGGFRAPSPAENGQSGLTYFAGTEHDPLLCADGNTQTPGNFPSQCSFAPPHAQLPNAALKPEISNSLTLGLLLQPLSSLSARLDYYAIEVKNQIVAGPSSVDDAVRNPASTPLPRVQADGSIRSELPPVGTIAYLPSAYINANATKTSGLELDLEYSAKLGDWGKFRSNFMLTHVLSYDTTVGGQTYHLAGTHGPFLVGGNTGNPRDRIQWSNSWSRGPLQLTATLNRVGGMDVTDPSMGMTDCLKGLSFGGGAASFAYPDVLQGGEGKVPDARMCRVAAFTTLDLSGKYEFSPKLSLSFAVLNLLDAKAPEDWFTYGGGMGAFPFNPSMHTQGAVGRFLNVGVKYQF